jgi:chromosome segregation protein
MSTARELAERAFTLLQDAFRESETRATELDAELKRRRDPKNRTEERADVLSHRLESVEAECLRWQQEVKRVEELLENEYAKAQQLRKKLEVAESGPDRVSKKEVNFWRQRAEQFDQETREYKNKIASLKQELRARAEAVSAGGFMPPTGSESDLVSALEAAREESKSLRERLDRQATELSALATTAASVSESSAPLQGEITRLAAELDRARRDLDRAQRELEQSQRELQGAQRELQGAQRELQGAQRELSSAQQGQNQGRLAATAAENARDKLTETLHEREARLVELSAAHEKARAELMTKSQHENALRTDLDRVRAELATSAKRVAQLEQGEQSARASKDQLQAALADREKRIQGIANELEQARNHQRRSHEELAEHQKRGDHLQAEQQARMEALRQEVAARNAQLAELQKQRAAADKELTTLRSQHSEAGQQIAGLEAELKEEKEYSANMNQLANERKDALTQTQEKVEETDERYKEAQWKLGKAQHFERLVQRRKGLIESLIAAIRAKSKANSALKAGLDGLRNFKAASEANHSKLLGKIDELTNELHQAEETINKQQGETFRNEELQAAHAKIKDLEARLNTQVEVIQTLENDLKVAKASHHSRDSATTELEEARKELAAKDELIAKLETDADEQQRKLSKLRGSESETMRLKAIEEKDKSLIDALEREVAQLREALKRQDAAPTGSNRADLGDLNAKLKERDGSINRLMATLKEKENEIDKLKESVAQWKKKYEFLSTEAPSAYQ